MRQCHYCDGTPSREVEEDFESTGIEEMDRLYKQIKTGKNVLAARDRISNVKDLLMVCIESLMESDVHEMPEIVGNVLYFQVIEQLKIIEEELKCTK